MDTSSPLPAPGLHSVPVPRAAPAAPARLRWLDRLRVALTVLVVVHHAAQPYGPDDWWYVEGQPRHAALGTLSAVDGSFFMSLFFFVSAVLVPGAYERRGARRFLTGRLLRLGVPVVVGALTLVPALMYAYYTHYRGYGPISYPHYFTDVYLGLGERPADWTGPSWPDLQFGHLWFVQNLLAYSVLYVLCRQLARLVRRFARRGGGGAGRPSVAPERPVPGHRALLALTLGLAVATYLIRCVWPLDTWIPVLDFLQVEPARLPQYASFFVLGVLAHRHGWLDRFPTRTGLWWLGGGLLGVCVLFAVGAASPAFGPGGPGGPSALWALYDSGLCVALCVGLLTLFRETADAAATWRSRELSGAAYAVYLVHVPLVVAFQYAVSGRGLTASASWPAVSVAALGTAFPLAALLRRLPGFRRVV